MIMKGVVPAAIRPTLQDVVSDELNFEVWSATMKTTLTEEGLWDVVENRIPQDPSKNTELALSLQVEEHYEWRDLVRKDKKALQILQSALTESVLRMNLSAASAKELWDLLNDVPKYVSMTLDLGDITLDEDMWMIYPYTSNHMTPYEKFFTNLDTTRKGRVSFTFGDTAMAEGIGDVRIMTKEGKKTIKNVLFVPGILGNALSVGQMEINGYEVAMDREKCSIWDRTTGEVFGETKSWAKRGYYMRLEVIEGNYHEILRWLNTVILE